MSSPLLSSSLLKYVDRDIAMSTSCSYKNKLTQYGRIWKKSRVMEYSNSGVKLIGHFFLMPFLLQVGVGIRGLRAMRVVYVD